VLAGFGAAEQQDFLQAAAGMDVAERRLMVRGPTHSLAAL
jgi:hypothetical protein